MKKIETLSKSAFADYSKYALENQPLRVQATFSEFEPISETTLKYKNKQINVTENAFDNYREFLKIPKGFLNRFEEDLGNENKMILIKTLKEHNNRIKNLKATFIFNQKNMDLLGILPPAKNPISNKYFVDSASYLINKNNLSITDYYVTGDGDISIQVIKPDNLIDFTDIDANETFFSGLHFSNTFKRGYEIESFMLRLACINGLILRKFNGFEHTITLKEIDEKSIHKFSLDFDDLKYNKFLPPCFRKRIQRAINTKSSINEMLTAISEIKKLNKIFDINMINEYMSIQHTFDKFNENGIDLIKNTEFNNKTLRSGISVWDTVNGMTYFASHEFKGININDWDRRTLKIKAGELLLKKSFDTENQLNQLF